MNSNVRLPFLLTALFLSICPLLYIELPGLFEFEHIKLYFLSFFNATLTIYFSYRYFSQKRTVVNVNFFLILALIFFGSGLISYIVNDNKYLTYWGEFAMPSGALFSQFNLFVFVIIVTNVVNSLYKTIQVMKVLVVSGGLLGFFSIVQKMGMDPEYWMQGLLSVNRTGSTLGQPVVVGSYLGIIAIMGVFIVLRSSEKSFFYFLFAWGLSVNGIFFGGSRAPIYLFVMSFIFVVTVLSLFRKHLQRVFNVKRIIIISSTLLALLFINFGLIQNMAIKKSSPQQMSLGMNVRMSWWSTGLKIFKQNPVFGVGPDNSDAHYKKLRPVSDNYFESWIYRLNKFHNDVIQILATQGLFGFSSYLAILLSALWGAFQLFRHGPSERRFVGLVLGTSIVFLFANNLFGIPLLVLQYLFQIIPALIIASWWKKNKKVVLTRSLFAVSTLIVFAVLVVGNFYLHTEKMIAFYNNQLTNARHSKGDFSGALESIDMAIRFDPNYHGNYCGRAMILTKMLNIQFNNSRASTSYSVTTILNWIEKDIIHCTELGRNNYFSFEQAATIYFALDQHDGKYFKMAMRSLEEAQKLYPTSPVFFVLKGNYLRTKGFYSEAIKELDVALSLKSNFVSALVEKIFCYYDAKDVDQAQEQIRQLEMVVNKYIDYVDFQESLKRDWPALSDEVNKQNDGKSMIVMKKIGETLLEWEKKQN